MSSVLLCNSSEESSSSTYIHEGQPGHLLSEKDRFYSKKKKKKRERVYELQLYENRQFSIFFSNYWKRLKKKNTKSIFKHLYSLDESLSDKTDPGCDFMAML